MLRAEGLASTEDDRDPSLLPEYADDPVGFARDILGIRLWGQQEAIALSVASNTRTAVKSGHKIGKSYSAVSVALWWVMTRERGSVIMTASSSTQVKTILWKALRKVYHDAGGDARFRPNAAHGIPLDPATGLRFDDVRTIYGFTTDNAERMQGHSGDQLLFIVDEASGFPDLIYEAVQGNMAGGGRILATGNPTKTTGWFFDAFHGKCTLWSTFSVDSRTTPNCTGDGEPIPGLAAPEWVAEMVEEYGGGDEREAENHPVFAVRVAGQFPTQADDAVISLGMVEEAKERWTPSPGTAPLEIGVDVARFGSDDTAIQPVRGNWAAPQVVVHGYDNVEVAGRVLEVARDLRRHGDEIPVVKVDAGGNGGGVADILARSREVRVVPVDAGSKSLVLNADGNPKFSKLRDELWWAAREWLLAGGSLPEDSRRDAELMAPVYGFDTALRIKVESKDDIKKRLKRSPDRADALCLAVWRQGAASAAVADAPRTHRASPFATAPATPGERGGGRQRRRRNRPF